MITKTMNKIETFEDETKTRNQPWTIRIVDIGDQYGLNDCLTHGEEKEDYGPMVEFYDPDGKETVLGQFVSRYYIQTLLDRDKNYGLDLYGGVPKWSVSHQMMNDILSYLKAFINQDSQ